MLVATRVRRSALARRERVGHQAQDWTLSYHARLPSREESYWPPGQQTPPDRWRAGARPRAMSGTEESASKHPLRRRWTNRRLQTDLLDATTAPVQLAYVLTASAAHFSRWGVLLGR